MGIDNSDIKVYLTTGSAIAGDRLIAQNDKTNSLGGTCSLTELLGGYDNLFKEWTAAQLLSSVRYACICLLNSDTEVIFEAVKLLAKDIDTYPAEVTIKIGVQSNDNTTAAPVCADDATPPTGITFVSLAEYTGDTAADDLVGYPIGPLNAPADGSTELDMDTDVRVFIYIEFACAGADSLNDLNFAIPLLGVDNTELDYELNWDLE